MKTTSRTPYVYPDPPEGWPAEIPVEVWHALVDLALEEARALRAEVEADRAALDVLKLQVAYLTGRKVPGPAVLS